MNILIFERDHTGHRMMGVRALLDALIELKQELNPLNRDLQITLATTGAAVNSPQYAEHLEPVAGQAGLVVARVPEDSPGLTPQASVRQALTKLSALDALVSQQRFDHVFVPYADGLIQLLTLARYWPLRRKWPAGMQSEAVMMRTGFAYSSASPVKRWLGRLGVRLSPFTRIHLIDPQAVRFLSEQHANLADRVELLPDPVSRTPPQDRATARKNLGLPADGRIIGCLGYLDERKGVDLLIRAFRLGPRLPGDRILLAGLHTDVARRQIAAAGCDQIISIDRYLSQDELADAISAVDLIATPYKNFTGSASIVIRAAAAQRPSIGVDAGWIGYVIQRFKLGHVCDIYDQNAFAHTLGKALDAARDFTLGDSARQFIDYSGPENIHAHWSKQLRRRLDLPPHPGYRSWPAGADQ